MKQLNSDKGQKKKREKKIKVRKDKNEKSCFVFFTFETETEINSLISRKQETTTSPTRKIGTERIQKNLSKMIKKKKHFCSCVCALLKLA